ncbi:hypothetical protein [Xanthomonas sp. 3075]|uniref:hypothetical protein n=1 Tax=Xanthomonas sp. 3075 TaxID=3035315 RepID=UPI00161CE3BD|nr:hypothetical protein [Xanthomonas sp. 3075]MBB4133296.1 CubicO group peptidase (beta-lactamase class C family) [Xanthomonas sp. 3075]
MQHTAWHLTDLPAGVHAMPYVSPLGVGVPIPPYAVTRYPAGGVRTSVNDLSTLFIALLDGGRYQGVRVLDAATPEQMLRFQDTAADKPDNIVLNVESGLPKARRATLGLACKVRSLRRTRRALPGFR